MIARSLRALAAGKGPLSSQRLKQIRRWLDADWESHDVDRDAVILIRRLLDDLQRIQSEQNSLNKAPKLP